MSDPITVTSLGDGVARVSWVGEPPVDVVRREVATALASHARVEALVDPDDRSGQRTATWAGLLREGVTRGLTIDGRQVDRIVYARVVDDATLN